MYNREQASYMAKVADQAELNQDAQGFLKIVLSFGQGLSLEQRNILTDVYYRKQSTLRRAFHQYNRQLMKENIRRKTIEPLIRGVEVQMRKQCMDFIEILQECLKRAQSTRIRIIYLKMIADQYRYLSEITSAQEFKITSKKAKALYEEAYGLVINQLKTTDPLRIGVILNYATYFYVIEGQTAIACELSQKALSELLADQEQACEQDYRNLQTLKDLLMQNLEQWKNP